MQKVKLPLTLNPIKAAQQRLEYTGYYASKQLSRLQDSTNRLLSDIEANLIFNVDPQRLVDVRSS